jgi:hypothetical protein
MKTDRIYKLFTYLNPDINFNILKEQFEVNNMPNLKVDIPIINSNSKIFKDVKIENDSVKILDDDFKPYKKYDFIILNDGNLFIGSGHYRLSKKAEEVKAAGEIMFDENGKIIYIYNESGHYRPSEQNLNDVAELFKKYRLFNPDYSVIHKRHNE